MKKVLLICLLLLVSSQLIADVTDYTYGCWINGWRKNANDKSDDLFAIVTSQYGFVLDMDNLIKVKIGPIKKSVSYEQALEDKAEKLKSLPNGQFLIDLVVDGVKYCAKTCTAGLDKGVKRLSNAMMWESGRYVQHYEFLGLDFRNAAGQKLECNANLDVVAWPNTITFNLNVSPESDLKDASMRLSFKSKAGNYSQIQKVETLWKKDDSKSIALTCNPTSDGNTPSAKITVSADDGKIFPVTFDKTKNCYVASVKHLKRKWKTGYTDIRNYDDFKITVNSVGKNEAIPFLLDLRPPANITGLCPMLCDENAKPIGIPVQLSKNWHHHDMGAYLMAYTMLPAEKDKTYTLRIAYGFYGELPSASHAQLSLVGYGQSQTNNNNGRWDQLAIGCWGETICFDMDMSCVDVAITDIRMLMARNGLKGRKWSWTDAGWGGDWLNIKDENQEKYFATGLKTAYLSHGPCLTNVKYDGYYGMNKEIDFKSQIQTLRTDDYARTFQKFTYKFESDVKPKDIWIFKIGRTNRYTSPQISYGNLGGLIKQIDIPDTIKPGEVFLKNTTLTGPGPWWVALPGSKHTTDKDWGTGYRALVIRDYKITANGKTYTNPTICAPVFNSNPKNIDIELRPPDGITQFKKGDSIQLDLEFITLHRTADDYYGPNEAYRKHLTENSNSWKTTHREAKGNDLKVKIEGGKVLNNYPVLIQANKPEVTVMIKGGVGAVPISFQGLKSPNAYSLYRLDKGKRIKLDQSVHGNDFWQTDYEPLTDSYKITYNVLLDNLKESKWILTRN